MADHLGNKLLNILNYHSATSATSTNTCLTSANTMNTTVSPTQSATSAGAQISTGTIVLTSQQSAAISQHLLMQQNQPQIQFTSKSSMYGAPIQASGGQMYMAHSISAQQHPPHQHHLDDNGIESTAMMQSQTHDGENNRMLMADDIKCEQDEVVDGPVQMASDEQLDDDDDNAFKREYEHQARLQSEQILYDDKPAFLPQHVIQSPSKNSVVPSETHPNNANGESGSRADYIPVLSTIRTTSTHRGSANSTPVYGRLTYKDSVLYISDHVVDIGRNSTTSSVHFHVGKNSFVSRKHLQVMFDQGGGDFYLVCVSKNGVFVDDTFQRKSSPPMKLPKSCTFRFPSTVIRILFENLCEMGATKVPPVSYPPPLASISDAPLPTTVYLAAAAPPAQPPPQHPNHQKMDASNSANVIYAPLKISIPMESSGAAMATIEAARAANTQQTVKTSTNIHLSVPTSGTGLKIKSPFPSPTGTISAANSCPTSPRHSSFHDYGYIRGSNSSAATPTASVTASFQDDLFQVPAAAAGSGNNNEYEKPPYSYAQLIVQSISASAEKQLTLSGIYSFITKHYQYYRKESNKGWQNSIRHNLSLNRYFIKVARSQDEPGKGSFWRIDPTSESKLIDQSYKKRRQRGSQCFRAPYGMPRSAPVSPSHVNEYQHSADNSPLHDIVLQSAPGSPGAGGSLVNDADSDYQIVASLSGSASSYSSFGNFMSGGSIKRLAPPKGHQSTVAQHSAIQPPRSEQFPSRSSSPTSSSGLPFRTNVSQPPPLIYDEPRYVQVGMPGGEHLQHHHFESGVDELDVATTTVVTTTSSDLHSHSDSCPSSPEPKRPRFQLDETRDSGVFHLADSTATALARLPPPTQLPLVLNHIPFVADPDP